GPIGDGLITLMDQKLSKLDDRLYELSSKITSAKIETHEIKEKKQSVSKSWFNFEKPKETKREPIIIPPTKPKQAFELTTLTNISTKDSKFPLFEKEESKQDIVNPIQQPKIIQSEIIKPTEEIVQEIIQQKPKVEDKIEIIQSVAPKPKSVLETQIDINKEVAKITEHKALPEPEQKSTITLDDDFDDDADDLDKVKLNIMKVLSKLDQAEVE
ncbi:MAG: hypothetical protein QQN42_08110, partial [Nitrosopumilus sp.]